MKRKYNQEEIEQHMMGRIYANKNDSNIFVRRKSGIYSWTMNLANIWTWVIYGVLAIVLYISISYFNSFNTNPSPSSNLPIPEHTPLTTKTNDLDLFLNLLSKNNLLYTVETSTDDNFLSAPRTPILIDDEIISVYQYNSNDDMENDSKYISKDGCSIYTPNQSLEISWTSYPHFFKKDTLIINYVGENGNLLTLLRTNYGNEFAGYDAVSK